MTDDKYALFAGRWCPPHKGHVWLIRQKLDEGVPCLILVRDTDEMLDAHTRAHLLRTLFRGEPVDVRVIPDIESVNWGRGVGYEPTEHEPPADIRAVSATEVRQQLLQGSTVWREAVPERIHGAVAQAIRDAGDEGT